MIMVKGILLTYGEAVARLDELKEKLEDAEEREDFAQQELDSTQMKGLQDLKQFLPTSLLTAGYKLSEVALSQYPVEGAADLFNVAYHPPVLLIVLEDNRGNVVRQWPGCATLSDIFEAAR